MSKRLGVCIVGANGAVASTVVAGVALMRKGVVPRIGMVTETEQMKPLDLAPVDGMVFGGWDLLPWNMYEAAKHHHVLPLHEVDQVKAELEQIQAWPAVVSPHFLTALTGKNVVAAKSFREEIAIIGKNITGFAREHDLDRLVMINLTSTEKYTEVGDVHLTIEAFEKGLDANDPRISPAMKYLYTAIQMGIPHANFTPSLDRAAAVLSTPHVYFCGSCAEKVRAPTYPASNSAAHI